MFNKIFIYVIQKINISLILFQKDFYYIHIFLISYRFALKFNILFFHVKYVSNDLNIFLKLIFPG